jgi:hypothetical protein
VLGYNDIDLAEDVNDSKSTSGMVFFLCDNPTLVTLCSCEAEYITGTGAACQAVWLNRLVEELLGLKMAAPRIRFSDCS